MTKILLNLIDNEKLRIEIGKNAKKTVEKKGNFKKNTDIIEKIYIKLADHAKKNR